MTLQALEISLFCVGLRLVTDRGMILDFLREPYLSGGTVTQILLKPVFGCIVCMASVWTMVLYPLLNGLEWKLIPTMFIVALFNGLIWNLYNKIEDE